MFCDYFTLLQVKLHQTAWNKNESHTDSVYVHGSAHTAEESCVELKYHKVTFM